MKRIRKLEKCLLTVNDLKKGVEIGFCRICGGFGKLTSDHMPPKVCGNNKRVRVNINGKELIFQNGFNCRTICEDCNNRLLGSSCDKVYQKLFNEIREFDKSKTNIADIIKIDIDVKNLVRSYLGHFIAVNMRGDKTVADFLLSEIDDSKTIFYKYRQYVLLNSDFENEFDVYYWYYPYSDIVIIPYAGCVFDFTKYNETSISGTILKMYPMVLFITQKNISNCSINITKIDFSKNELEFDTYNIVHRFYPEHPLENGMILTDSSNLINVKR